MRPAVPDAPAFAHHPLPLTPFRILACLKTFSGLSLPSIDLPLVHRGAAVAIPGVPKEEHAHDDVCEAILELGLVSIRPDCRRHLANLVGFELQLQGANGTAPGGVFPPHPGLCVRMVHPDGLAPDEVVQGLARQRRHEAASN